MAGYIDTWGRGTLKIIQACKEAGLAEPLIEQTNGGIAVTLYNREYGKPSENLRKTFGMSSEEIWKKFGTISTLINSEATRNNALIQDHFEGFMDHLQGEFGITSEKLRNNFGKENTQSD